ncbi:hypothetical protein Acr_05g0002360 [Actinidia rufa]|uniref:Retrovirus-related Pol polyprotein from transposon TNT 1-94-like beta-barrel domain-containing protein n=1 Tax=Actinidia rufa TaxID=165716 RepID=A0A7J0EM08_9ERIC|nr:hypothetical protein Acr_05g0002360 [Actinidia rufa]
MPYGNLGWKTSYFCKDLHDPLENKGEKPVAKKDEEWRKMNRKTIGLIRQCIGHEVFHHVAQETSAYELWIKLKEMYQAKTSRNKALLMRRLVNLKLQRETIVAEHTSEFQKSWETLVVSLSNSAPNGKLTTSMVMDALFNEEAQTREMGSTDQSESQVLVLEGSRERGRGQGRGHHRGIVRSIKAQVQSSDTAATTVMAVDEDESDVLLAASDNGKSDWVLDSGSAYHLCKDREVFSTYAACEGHIWMANNTSSRVVGRGSVRFLMADRRSVTLTERAIPIGGECPRHEELLSDMGPIVLERRMDKESNRCTEVSKVSAGVPRGSEVDVHREAQRKETKSILRSCTAKGTAPPPKRVSFALDLISGGVLSSCAHKGGEMESRQTRKVTYFAAHSGGGCKAPQWGGGCRAPRAGSEAVRKGQLKTSDYPPVGWRGRLLSPVHLDESKPTWMSQSPVAKPKPDWSSYGVSM